MQTLFAHLADIHLGNQQYGLSARFDDFGHAWLDAVDRIIERRVRFVLLAGDFFDRRQVEPLALLQAIEGLRRFREAGIPAIAVEGNHDRALYGEGFSWMEYLAAEGHLILLNPCPPGGGGIHYQAYGAGQGWGSYVDLEGVRIVGQPYLGAAARRALGIMADSLRLEDPGDRYVVYLCHAGLEGVLPHYSACLTREELDPIRPHVDYLALGHIHLRFERDGWIYNPGSLETCRSNEAEFERGINIVQVDTALPEKHSVEHLQVWRRPFTRLSFPMDGIGSPEALAEALPGFLRGKVAATEDAPVVELKLTGVIRYDPARLDVDAVRECVRECCRPLHVELKNETRIPNEAFDPDEELTREDLERKVLAELFSRDARYRPQAEEWARLAGEIKLLAQDSFDAKELVEMLVQRADELGALPALLTEAA